MGVTLNIPDSVIQGLRIPEGEIVQRLRTELAVALYAQGALSPGKAAELAEMIEWPSANWSGSGGSRGTTATRSWRKTPLMLVAGDTSPISNLAIIGRLNLLRSQFSEIWIPDAVRTELHQLRDSSALREVQQALTQGWIKPRVLREDKVARLLKAMLDPGEAESIALALELSADLILLDVRSN